jgi:ABC-type lipopolysaccharide export system ATPase subunit
MEKRNGDALIVNLFGGPGAGKSTTAAGVFSLLKLHAVSVELVTEYAKDLTWEKRMKTLSNQYYVFGKQHHRLFRLADQVDVVITDSPILLSLVYGDTNEEFKKTVIACFKEFNNANYIIRRTKNYVSAGRNQTEEEALTIDGICQRIMGLNDLPFSIVPGEYRGINAIAKELLDYLGLECKFRFAP